MTSRSASPVTTRAIPTARCGKRWPRPAGYRPHRRQDEESIDFKRMVHGIHAAAVRENKLQIVGFGGFSVHVYDEEEVQFPGDLSNCTACHTSDGFTLPLPSGVLGTTIDTGSNHASPVDDTVITPSPRCAKLPRWPDRHRPHAGQWRQLRHHPEGDRRRPGGGDLRRVSRDRPDADVAVKHNVHAKPIQ